jgi:hypothetical protein
MERVMSPLNSPNLLRFALTIDAIASGASALLLLAGAGFLSGLLGLPQELLRIAGIVLVPFVALVGYLATREAPSAGAVWAVILINIAWVLGSVFVLVGGLTNPTMLGYAFVAAQAVAVLILADLQYFGLRRITSAA